MVNLNLHRSAPRASKKPRGAANEGGNVPRLSRLEVQMFVGFSLQVDFGTLVRRRMEQSHKKINNMQNYSIVM